MAWETQQPGTAAANRHRVVITQKKRKWKVEMQPCSIDFAQHTHHTTNEHLLVRESKRRGYFNYLQDEACKERKTIRRCFVASRTCLSGLVYNMTSVQHNFQMAGKLIFDRICSANWAAAAAETTALLQVIYTKKHWSEIKSLLRAEKIEQHFFR